jgi:hypothetical protein
MHTHVCGLYFFETYANNRKYLPVVSQSIHSRIISTTSRSTLTQTYVNPSPTSVIPELRYVFPLYDGVSVVGFTCTINGDRVIHGVVKEKHQARQTYDSAVARGETAGLLEQLPEASDVFSTTIGNVPAGAEIKVDITFLGELKHDAEVDGIRFTIPTSIAPRYGSYPGELLRKPANVTAKGGIQIVVDAEMPTGSVIKSVQSPSHPISISIGTTSAMAENPDVLPSLQYASATLSLQTADLDKDFILQVIATNTSNPVAILETHPTIPNQKAIMTTLVPKFNLPSSRPEVVFVCDRSGSMEDGHKIPNVISALKLFLKSLPIGVKFNICSFGSHFSYLFPNGSVSYDQNSLDAAIKHIEKFDANFGGTEIYQPLADIFKRRYKDMDLEVFVLTDGEVWNQESLFQLVDDNVKSSKGAIRLFTLGVGNDVSHSLIEGLARAGNGFAQTVSDNEKMDSKVIRMLKASLMPHVKDYSLEVKYSETKRKDSTASANTDEDFEVVHVERVLDGLAIDVKEPEAVANSPSSSDKPKKTISLFDPTVDPDVEMQEATPDDNTGTSRYSHIPWVATPRLLQTPCTIPQLFPFNRTSVYLLLSPETAHKTPVSVVLRGTTQHCPVELEIPVSILPEKGETIHQLAARNAVKELEEHRGWIFHAKEKGGAKLLKDKYEGRFQDMVEREAVRLGVQYQVGGKWCSFVAVDGHNRIPASEGNTSADEGGMERRKADRMQDYSPPKAKKSSRLFSLRKASAGGQAPPPPPPPAPAPKKPSPPASYGAVLYGVTSTANEETATPKSSWMARTRTVVEQACRIPAPMRSNKAPAGPPVVVAAALAAPAAPVHDSLIAQYQKEMSEAACMPLPDMDLDDDPFVESSPSPSLESSVQFSAEKRECAPAREAFSPSKIMNAPISAPSGRMVSMPTAAPAEPINTLDSLVTLQMFAGFWIWSDQLFTILNLDKGRLTKSLDSTTAKGKQDVMATIAVVSYMRTKLASEKESWEMLAEKALQWLEGQLGGSDTVEEAVSVAGALF